MLRYCYFCYNYRSQRLFHKRDTCCRFARWRPSKIMCVFFKMLVKCEKLCSLPDNLFTDFPKLDLHAFGVKL